MKQPKKKHRDLTDFKPKPKKKGIIHVKKSTLVFYGYPLEELRENLKNNHDSLNTLKGIYNAFTSTNLSLYAKKNFAKQLDDDLKKFIFKDQQAELKKLALNVFKILLEEYNYLINSRRMLTYIKLLLNDRSSIVQQLAEELYQKHKLHTSLEKTEQEIHEKVKQFEIEVRNFICKKLKECYGEQWFNVGVPLTVQKDIKDIQLKNIKNNPNLKYDRDDCLNFGHYSIIVNEKKNRQKIFKQIFPNYIELLYSLDKLNAFRNDLSHPPLKDKTPLKVYNVWIENIMKHF